MTKVEDQVKAEFLGRLRAGSKNWHRIRRTRLGGSEIASVVGLSPYKSHYALWCEKSGLIKPASMDPTRARIGKHMESLLSDVAARHLGVKMVSSGMFAHRQRAWQVAEPDRFAIDDHGRVNGILEIKTVDPMMAFEWGPDGGDHRDIPPYYDTQVQWCLSTMGLAQAHLIALFGLSETRIYSIERNDDYIDHLLEMGHNFVTSVRDGVMPDIDESDSTYQAIRELHPDIAAGEQVPLERQMVCDLLQAQSDLKVAQADFNRARSQVADAMGNAQWATYAGQKVATRQSRSGSKPFVTVARGAKIPSEVAAPDYF